MIDRTYENIVKIAEQHIPIIVGLIVGTTILLLAGISLKTIVFLPILYVVASISTYYKRYIQMPLTFELISVTTVTIGVVYGPWVGALFGVSAGLSAEIISGGIDAFIPVNLTGRFLMGFLAGIVTGDFVVLGMALTILYTIIVQAPYVLYGDPQDKIRTVFFASVSLLVNYSVFTVLGRPLLRFLY